uniref:Xylellain. Cysteine peptidase. MEROPS family C01A n=1 Tax=Hirondellea gigas TaxID=1518452 RepID=A0A6A7FZX3_9CRUS
MGSPMSLLYGASVDHKGPSNHYYGWNRDRPDERDHIFRVTLKQVKSASEEKMVDLRERCPKVYDQGALGSCTANAIGGAFEFDLLRQQLGDFIPSRLFIYFNERVIEGSVSYDAGAEIRDGIKTINKDGVCHEADWPYDISKFTEKPPKDCYLSAKGNLCLKYSRVSQKVESLKAVLVHERIPIVFGFAVHESFEDPKVAETGRMPMPGSEDEDPILGGHAVAVVGFNEEERVFIIRNSWGGSWGDSGYFYMPYDFISNPDECSDFWVVKYVEEDFETGDAPVPEPVPDAEKADDAA